MFVIVELVVDFISVCSVCLCASRVFVLIVNPSIVRRFSFIVVGLSMFGF